MFTGHSEVGPICDWKDYIGDPNAHPGVRIQGTCGEYINFWIMESFDLLIFAPQTY